ncbi:hypothetical protein ACFVYP_06905 [Kitasatospora sp. NPDC058201]|uniref:hypothetical protein n=1 Tax=unclassified Kitasatospora TaxID=2633591 RepID=UPI00366399AF
MIPCPHPDCTESMDDVEVTTLYGTTGPRMYATCPAGHRFEVDVLVIETQPAATEESAR